MRHFICRGTVSAVTWAGAWIGCGYFLSDAVAAVADRPGVNLLILFVAPITLYLFLRRARRPAADQLASSEPIGTGVLEMSSRPVAMASRHA
jgi:membrane protein DedA with SNARE-associated domain